MSRRAPPSYPPSVLLSPILSPLPVRILLRAMSRRTESRVSAPRIPILHPRRIHPAGTRHRGYIAGPLRCPICARDGTGAAKISGPLSSTATIAGGAGKDCREVLELCLNGVLYLRDCRRRKSSGACRVDSRWRDVAAPISPLRSSGRDVSRSTMPRDPGSLGGIHKEVAPMRASGVSQREHRATASLQR